MTVAVAAALADDGRRGVLLQAHEPDEEASRLLAGLRGDITIEPGRIATMAPTNTSSLLLSGWLAQWPVDSDALAGALALSAAFPEHLAALEIGIEGDVAEAAGETLERLAADGVTEAGLPDILIRPATEADRLPLAELAEHLARACDHPAAELWIGDDHGDGAAESLLQASIDDAHLALISDDLDRITELAATGRLTLISDSPLLRSVCNALPRNQIDLLDADLLALDGRRPQDLWLAARARAATVLVAHAERHSAASLRAFGLEPAGLPQVAGALLAAAGSLTPAE